MHTSAGRDLVLFQQRFNRNGVAHYVRGKRLSFDLEDNVSFAVTVSLLIALI